MIWPLLDSSESGIFISFSPINSFGLYKESCSQRRAPMSADVNLSNDMTVVTLAGKVLDASTAKGFRTETIQLWENGKRYFIIDMSTIEFMDSAGMGAIILLYKTVGGDGRVCLAGVKGQVEDVLTMVNLKSLIPIYPTVDAAIKQLQVTK